MDANAMAEQRIEARGAELNQSTEPHSVVTILGEDDDLVPHRDVIQSKGSGV